MSFTNDNLINFMNQKKEFAETYVNTLFDAYKKSKISKDTMTDDIVGVFIDCISEAREVAKKDKDFSDSKWEEFKSEIMSWFCLVRVNGKLVLNNKILSSLEEERRANIDIEELLGEFDEFHLSDVGKDELKGYFNYLFQDKVTGIPYNFIVQTENIASGYSFAEKLESVIRKIKGSGSVSRYNISEKSMLNNFPQEYFEAYDMIMIYDTLPDELYYSSDFESSLFKTKKKTYDDNWDYVMDFLKSYPDKVVLLCTNKDILQGRIRNNQRLYYRFFRHHIYIGNMTEAEIYDVMMKKINEKIGRYTDDFEDLLKEYINTVYYRTNLKNTEFVDDLFEWMVTLTIQKTGKCECFSELSIPKYHRDETFESIDREFQMLVGMEKVKETFRNIGILCQNISKDGKKPYMHMVFRGNPGTGKTTVAHFVAKLLSSMHVIEKNHVIEVMTADLLGQYVGQTGPKVNEVLKRASGGVLFIDEAYLLNSSKNDGDTYREECIGTLMKAMDNRSEPVVIFAGYPDEMDNLLNSNPGLKSRIGYIIDFEDYNNEQLIEIFKTMCQKAGYEYDEVTLKAVERKIIALGYEDNFGNARTVEAIFNQAVIEALRENHTNLFISADNIKIDTNGKTLDELISALNARVGIKKAKETILDQINSNRFCMEQGKELPLSNNMVFVGNPGTGKTTTAKLFSEMMFSIGITKSPRTKMITAKDLYVTDAAKAMNAICREAMGGVLFIDEIYMLQNAPSICAVVVTALLEILEEKKEDLVVILAGYEKQIEDFLNENPGLLSRFPIKVHFDDFTEDELCEVFLQECQKDEMEVSEAAMNQFRQVIRAEMKKDNFGNGRTVRNIYEMAFRKHATNYYNKDHSIDRNPNVIEAEDIEMPIEVNENKTKMGF